MDEDSIKLNLKSLEELILDENKLVNYVYLSKKLCIHVNDSKMLLCTFVQNIKSDKPDIALDINYLISGLTGEHSARTTVCCENDLKQIKKTLQTVFFEHIYSVCKGLPDSQVDNAALVTVNSFSDFPSCLGLIKNEKCAKHTINEIGNLKSHSYESSLSKLQPKPEINTQISKKLKQEPNTVDIRKNHEKKNVTENKHESTINKIEKSPQKKPASMSMVKKNGRPQQGITGFFSKQNGEIKKEPLSENKLLSKNKHTKDEAKVAEETNKNVKSEDKSVISEPIKETSKIPCKVKVKDTTHNQHIKEESKVTNDIFCDVNGDNEELSTNKNKKQSKNKKTNIQTNKKNINSKSIIDIKKNAKVVKKRKRVLHVSDSDSDNDPFVDEDPTKESIESEDEIPPTPTINVVKVASGAVNPKKRRKIVDKTYTDEDGYILTKKEEVYESCSDNDEIGNTKENNVQVIKKKEVINKTSPKKKNEPKKGKKTLSPEKGKQTTLMSFFKKS